MLCHQTENVTLKPVYASINRCGKYIAIRSALFENKDICNIIINSIAFVNEILKQMQDIKADAGHQMWL